MVRIAIVIPYASMASLAQEVFQEHTAQMRLQQRDSTDYSLEIVVAPTTQELQIPDCDAMIVRGATYSDLCRNALSVPVIELIINGTDIVNMLLQLRQKYGAVPAAVLGTQNMILGVEKLARQLNVDVTPYCLRRTPCRRSAGVWNRPPGTARRSSSAAAPAAAWRRRWA